MTWGLIILVGVVTISLGDYPPLRWKASLDDPPNVRWAHIQQAYAQEIHALAKAYADAYSPFTLQMYASLLDLDFFSSELQQELETLALVANITYPEAVFMNFIYEYNAYCTSIVVRMQNGTVIHGRNLDYPLGDYIRKTTADVDVFKNGTLLYTMTWFTWYLGVTTAIKPGKFSMSLNERNTGNWAENVAALFAGYKGNFFRARTAMEQADSYEEAVEYLATASTVSPSYEILAGLGVGTVLTRNRGSSIRPIALDEDLWYLVQTNHDWWTPDPVGDNRTAVAEAYLNAVGQAGFDEIEMVNALSQVNVLNPDTLFTTVMVPETGYYSSVVRDSSNS